MLSTSGRAALSDASAPLKSPCSAWMLARFLQTAGLTLDVAEFLAQLNRGLEALGRVIELADVLVADADRVGDVGLHSLVAEPVGLDLGERQIVVDGALGIALHDRVHAEREPRVDIARIFLDDLVERLDRLVEISRIAFGARQQQANHLIVRRRLRKRAELLSGDVAIAENELGVRMHASRVARRGGGSGENVAGFAREPGDVGRRPVAIEEAQQLPPEDRIAALPRGRAERVRVGVRCGREIMDMSDRAQRRGVGPDHRRRFVRADFLLELALQLAHRRLQIRFRDGFGRLVPRRFLIAGTPQRVMQRVEAVGIFLEIDFEQSARTDRLGHASALAARRRCVVTELDQRAVDLANVRRAKSRDIRQRGGEIPAHAFGELGIGLVAAVDDRRRHCDVERSGDAQRGARLGPLQIETCGCDSENDERERRDDGSRAAGPHVPTNAARVDRAHDVFGGLEATARFQLEQTRAQSHRESGKVVLDRVRRRRIAHDALREHFRRRAAAKRQRAGQHLEEDQAERIEIAASVDGIGARLFGREIFRRADDDAADRDAGRSRRARDAEIGDARFAVFGHQHVRGFQVAVDDAALMRGRKAERELAHDLDRIFGRQDAFRIEQPLQRLARHEIHADQPDLAMPHEIVDAHDVRARHLPRQQQLLAETLERVGPAGELGPQQFQRDIDIELHVVRVIDDAHAAHAEQAHDAKTIGDDIAGPKLRHREHAGDRRATACCGMSVRPAVIRRNSGKTASRRDFGPRRRARGPARARRAGAGERRFHARELGVDLDRRERIGRAFGECLQKIGIEIGEDLRLIVRVGIRDAEQTAFVLQRQAGQRADAVSDDAGLVLQPVVVAPVGEIDRRAVRRSSGRPRCGCRRTRRRRGRLRPSRDRRARAVRRPRPSRAEIHAGTPRSRRCRRAACP